ncbi:MAG: hypothetical protein K6U12_06450 [Armatimonadetes bacterium]|nr:hypothetical protein [Armatimonadota bacterium]CUU34641.1 hypothetical protein DCOP10_10970 [Armatimonadetes bacterium DC]
MRQNENTVLRFRQYAWQEIKGRIATVFKALVIAIPLAWLIRWQTNWWDYIDPLLNLLTLGVALFVGIQQLRRSWEEYLPNRLTVYFYYHGREVMRCEKAYLANESDIRALGQQIGAQMAETRELKFVAPMVEISPPEVNEKEGFIHYTAKFYLRELSDALKALDAQGQLPLIWKPPFREALKPESSPAQNET